MILNINHQIPKGITHYQKFKHKGVILRIGYQEILVILLILILLFGAKKIPELAKGLGTALREFRKASKEIESDINKPTDTEEK